MAARSFKLRHVGVRGPQAARGSGVKDGGVSPPPHGILDAAQPIVWCGSAV